MDREYDARGVPASQRAHYWKDVVSREIIPLDTSFRAEGFDGVLRTWGLGAVTLVRMRSRAVRYRRKSHHVADDSGDTVLVSFSSQSDVEFSQGGVDLACRGKQFFLEKSHQPSDFHQTDVNDIWTLKVPVAVLENRVRSAEPFFHTLFDADAGAGGLLFDTLQHIPQRHATSGSQAAEGMGALLVDLLVLALENDARARVSHGNSVQRAHRARAETFIRQNLQRADLTPELIAGSCRISVRYLHALFQGSGASVARWIRELRLEACRRQLCEAHRREGIAEIAYRWGFSDQAQFSRHFKARFGKTAGDMRAESRLLS